jgi:chorismate mutase
MIQELRRQIAENDRRIAAALNARIALVARLKAHKEARGLGFVDAAQEERLLADLDRKSVV